MCGFIAGTTFNEEFIKRRGDTLESSFSRNGINFKHFLLNVTGEINKQPFVEDDIVVLYNGEIYNYPYKISDGENIIPLYKKWGALFPKYLDGEWAIAVYDFKARKIIFSTDLFGTKPLWVNGLECASYESGVGGEKMPPNTIRTVDMDTLQSVDMKIHLFDFNNQTKNTYDDWIKAFEKAIKKRAIKNCFIGLSSGYDSGAIACAINNLSLDFRAYSIVAGENLDTIEQRQKIHNGEIIHLTKEQYARESEFVDKYVEQYTYRVSYNDKEQPLEMKDDVATRGLSYICRLAKERGCKVYLSGQGADEITSDYGKWAGQSELKGVYPKELKEWSNFYGNFQDAYIAKEEYVAGAWAMETRYPFLDKDVVQEFLWLTPELKNKEYKAPICEYLRRNKYPFDYDRKVGFGANINLK